MKSGPMNLVFILGDLRMQDVFWHNRKEVTVIISVQLISQGEIIKESIYRYSHGQGEEEDPQ